MPTMIGNTSILSEEFEIDARLHQIFDVTREELIAIAHAAVGAKNDSVPDDPINAPGQFAYIYGTRGVRVLFHSKGYITDRTDNIESVVHPKTRVRVIYQNTETAAQPYNSPKAISGKGTGSERLIDLAQPYLLEDMEEERKAKLAEAKKQENETVWFLCVASGPDGIWAEISRPRKVENNQFGEFIERIFLIQGDDGQHPQMLEDDLPVQDYEINVSRK